MYQFPRRKNQLFVTVSIYGVEIFAFYPWAIWISKRVFFLKTNLHQHSTNKIRLCISYWIYHEMRPSLLFFHFSHIMHFLNAFFLYHQRHKTRITFSLTCFASRESSSFDCLCVCNINLWIKWLEASEIYWIFSVLYVVALDGWIWRVCVNLIILWFFFKLNSHWKLSMELYADRTSSIQSLCSFIYQNMTNRLLFVCLFISLNCGIWFLMTVPL